MYLKEMWSGFDGAAGSASAWFPITRLVKPTISVWGLHAADVVKIWHTNEDNPVTDTLTNATEIVISHTAGANVDVYPEEQQGYLCIELDVKTTSVATRRARFTAEPRG